MQNILHDVASFFTPVLKESKFLKEGVLTPEEFVAAGDLLIRNCPTWAWQPVDGRAQRDYLPSDKQMLATRGVPCVQRANQLASGVTDTVVDGEGDWTAATAVVSSSEPEQQSVVVDGAALLGGLSGMHIEYSPVAGGGGGSEAPSTHSDAELVNTAHPTGGSSGGDGDDDDDDDEFADMTQFDEDSAAVSAPSAAPAAAPATKSASGPTTLSTRTYDITITYDKYYQTPRVYFRGYDESHNVLTAEQIFEDVMQDYTNKTVTMERHPLLPKDGMFASIHPCRHAQTMKAIVTQMVDNGKAIRPDQYIFLFLKFIQSVIPTVDYDHTIAIEG